MDVLITVAVFAVFAWAGIKRSKAKAASGGTPAPKGSGRGRALAGLVILAVGALTMTALIVLSTRPDYGALSEYSESSAREALEQGKILDMDAENSYESLRSRMRYTGATGEETDIYWREIAGAETRMEQMFWQIAAETIGHERCWKHLEEMQLRLEEIEG